MKKLIGILIISVILAGSLFAAMPRNVVFYTMLGDENISFPLPADFEANYWIIGREGEVGTWFDPIPLPLGTCVATDLQYFLAPWAIGDVLHVEFSTGGETGTGEWTIPDLSGAPAFPPDTPTITIPFSGGPCTPGEGTGTSAAGESTFIDVCLLPDTGLGSIDPNVTFDPEFGPVTVDVTVTENVLQIAPSCPNGKFPMSYGLTFTGDTNQTFHVTLEYTGWYHGSPSSIYYWDGAVWTYPDNIMFGTTDVAFDITNPGPAVCFHLKNKPQPDSAEDLIPFTNTNYPNPFNPDTNIAFSISQDGLVTLEIYNVKGQKVRTLVNSELEAGAHQVTWDGKETNGKTATSGIYFYKLVSGTDVSTKKMILMK